MNLCQKPYKSRDTHTVFPILLSEQKAGFGLPQFAGEEPACAAAPLCAVLRGPGAASLLVLVFHRGLKLR